MIKNVSPDLWDFGQSYFNVVKRSNRGLIGNDLAAFIKSAGDEAAHRVRQLEQHARPGEQLLHLLAMGATEIISPNRNGDGWKMAVLLRSYPTFTKYAFWHRNHKVEESDGVYGKVRDSWFNHKMGRVELLVGLFETKEAARSGHAKRGRVADKEIHMLDQGKEIPVSMSGYVPFDICSSCENKAKGRKEYCRGEPHDGCKHGGLYHNIGRVFEDGHHLHADNPDTKFFDISGIFDEHTLQPDRQADRVAYALGRVKSGSAIELDRDVPTMVPWQIFGDSPAWGPRQARLLQTLVGLEKQSSLTYQGTVLEGENVDGNLTSRQTEKLLQGLAKQGILLNLSDFATVCGASSDLAHQAEPYAKTAFDRLAKSYDLIDILENNPFRFSQCFEQSDPRKALFSMSPESVRKRAWLDCEHVDKPVEKHLIADTSAEALADLHALYRLGFATSLEKSSKLDLILNSIARHNRF